jgi:general stress protein 26
MIQTPADVFRFFSSHNLMALATKNTEGHPEVSHVYFVADEGLNLYFCTRNSLRKTKNLTAHPEVAVSVIDEYHQTVIQLNGVCEEYMDHADLSRVTQLFDEKILQFSEGYPPILQLKEGHFVMYRIVPNWIRIGQFFDGAEQKFIELDLA